MKILLDTCVWGGARVALVGAGHDVVWSGDLDQDPGDTEVLSMAHREGRVLVTLDKDFGQLAVLKGQPHAGIVRLVGIRAREQGSATADVLAAYGAELSQGAMIVVEPDRVRIRLSEARQQ